MGCYSLLVLAFLGSIVIELSKNGLSGIHAHILDIAFVNFLLLVPLSCLVAEMFGLLKRVKLVIFLQLIGLTIIPVGYVVIFAIFLG